MKKLKLTVCLLTVALGLGLVGCQNASIGSEEPAQTTDKAETTDASEETTRGADPDETTSDAEPTDTAEEDTASETDPSETVEDETTAETGPSEIESERREDVFLPASEWDKYDSKGILSPKYYPFPMSKKRLASPTPELIDLIFSEANQGLFLEIQFTGNQDMMPAYRRVRDDYGREFAIYEQDFYQDWWLYNGLRELETREDAIPCLLEAYRNSDVSDSFGSAKMNGDDYRLMQCLEVVLSQDVYLDRMTDEEKATLYELIEDFHGADRSGFITEQIPVIDQSYRFYPYYPVSEE